MATVRDLEIDQNSKFEYTLNVLFDGVLVPLTGYTARMAVRANRQDDAELLASLDAYLTVVAPAAQVQVDIPGAVTALWDWDRGAYDINVIAPGGERYRVLQGDIRVNHTVIV